MLNRPARMTATLAAMLTATTAFAEPTIEELDTRMRAMENTMQSILELLQEQQAANQVPTAGTPDASPIASSATAGGLYMDVFVRAISREEKNAIDACCSPDPSNMPDGPKGVADASVIVQVPVQFDYGAFLDQPALAHVRSAKGLVGVQWSGYLNIQEPGDYTFSLAMNRAKGSGLPACRSTLRLEGKVITDVAVFYSGWGSGGASNERSDVDQAKEPLAKGLYSFSLWTNCLRYEDSGFKLLATELKMAGPRDRSLGPIPPEMFQTEK